MCKEGSPFEQYFDGRSGNARNYIFIDYVKVKTITSEKFNLANVKPTKNYGKIIENGIQWDFLFVRENIYIFIKPLNKEPFVLL